MAGSYQAPGKPQREIRNELTGAYLSWPLILQILNNLQNLNGKPSKQFTWINAKIPNPPEL